MRYFTFVVFHAKSSKLYVYFTLRAQLRSQFRSRPMSSAQLT